MSKILRNTLEVLKLIAQENSVREKRLGCLKATKGKTERQA